MITTKREFEVIVDMYKELKMLGDGLQCDHSVGICACGIYDMLDKGKEIIEKSAKYLGYVPKKGKNDEWVSSNQKKVK